MKNLHTENGFIAVRFGVVFLHSLCTALILVVVFFVRCCIVCSLKNVNVNVNIVMVPGCCWTGSFFAVI